MNIKGVNGTNVINYYNKVTSNKMNKIEKEKAYDRIEISEASKALKDYSIDNNVSLKDNETEKDIDDYGYSEAAITANYKEDIEHSIKEKSIEVHDASFESLSQGKVGESHRNIDLILDVPLDVSVVLGRTKKSIKDILNLSTGSLIELDKLAEEPVEILVNGKKIAYGEVVVVDENFGVRITSIVSGVERIKSLR